jgi:hypothetical protein
MEQICVIVEAIVQLRVGWLVSMARLTADEISTLDPYKFMAVIGRRVIHPGGRASTESLLRHAGITAWSTVLDVGCGVATTAAHPRKMAWLMPRMAKAVPYLGYIVVASAKPG